MFYNQQIQKFEILLLPTTGTVLNKLYFSIWKFSNYWVRLENDEVEKKFVKCLLVRCEKRRTDEAAWEVTSTQSVEWERKTRRRKEWSYYYLNLFIFNFYEVYWIFLNRIETTENNFFCLFWKKWRRRNFIVTLFFEWRRTRSAVLETCPTCSSAFVFSWCYLWGLRQRDDLSNAELFSTRFFPSPHRRSFFLFPVPDRISKSKFLFLFSFSFRERFP